jgi:hypothetical protein
MASDKKHKLGDLEKKFNVIVTAKGVRSDRSLTEAEFIEEYIAKDQSTVVDHVGRTKWLEDNGYEVTRANMLDGSLTVKAQED